MEWNNQKDEANERLTNDDERVWRWLLKEQMEDGEPEKCRLKWLQSSQESERWATGMRV